MEQTEAARQLMQATQDMGLSTYQLELPIDGSEDSEFLKMGIEFGPFQPGDKWRGANLPEGWSLEPQSGGKRSYICDERQRARVIIHIGPKQMRPLQRFRIGRDPYVEDPDENVLFCIWDSNVKCPDKPKVVLEARYTVPSRERHKDVYESRIEIYQTKFDKDARKWLADRYPDWESYSGHWDEEDDQEESNEEADQEASQQEGLSGEGSHDEGDGNQGETT